MEDTISLPPVPAEAYERYPGQWVALHCGRIVAASPEREELERDERLSGGEIIFHVPSTTQFFTAGGLSYPTLYDETELAFL